MQNEIQIFQNPEFGNIRGIEIDGKPWVVGKDVAVALGYSNTKDAIGRHVDDEDKRGSQITTPSGRQTMTVINESGIYALIFGSKMEKAREFKRWVTTEVLPTIREHGAYMTPETIEKVLSDPDTIIKLATNLKKAQEERDRLAEKNHILAREVAVQKMMLAEATPKASYYDLVLQTPDLISVSKIAKDYGKSPQWLNQYLNELGVQYRQGRLWLLYQKYAEQGYTKTKTALTSDPYGKQHSTLHTYWTQKGRLFIYDLLKQNGILPTIERDMTA